MPSPFPGMDPWLERRSLFSGFHDTFISELRRDLAAQLRTPYFAELNSRIWVEESRRSIVPDVNILRPAGPRRSGGTGGATAVAEADPAIDIEPLLVTLTDDEHHENYLEIRYGADGERLVTAIELLSPSNKTPGDEGRTLYLAKQREMLLSDVNFLEIDLLRGGVHTTLAPNGALATPHGRCPWHIVLRPMANRMSRLVYPIQIWNRLPRLDVPLLPEDGSISIDLQPIFDRCYELGRYAMRVRYGEPPPYPPLRDFEAEHAARRLNRAVAPDVPNADGPAPDPTEDVPAT